MDQTRRETVQARLGLWDAVSIIVGIIIGVGIFQTPSKIFELAPGPWAGLSVWAAGGLLALLGAFCFAELASTYPRSGGEYVYLTRAYGPLAGFLFGWAQLAVIRPGSIGALAYIVAEYGANLWTLNGTETFLLAVGSVLALTVINILGVTLGKNTQNLLTVTKVAGLVLIVVVGFGWGRAPEQPAATAYQGQEGWLATALIFVLWTYSGWHEAAYIVAEIKDSRRNIPLALMLGTTLVTVIYLAVNAAFLFALGFERARGNQVPEQVLSLAWGGYGSRAISILIMISALGAINGMIFTTARIYSEFGQDHRLFQPISKWSRRWGTPVRALVTQACLTLTLLVGVGIWVRLDAELNISKGFDKMVEVTAAVFWLFFFLTGISLFVLRAKDPGVLRPFRVPGYPVVPLIFCLSCAYMVYGAIEYTPWESLVGLGILLLGVIFYFLPKKIKRHGAPEPNPPVPAGAV
jgi:basic amino acid/polyamine antiporter, APA family